MHEFAQTIRGRVVIQVGPGVIPSGAADRIGGDLVLELIHTLNPFSKSEPYSELECAVFAVRFNEGNAVIAPVAVRTDKLTVVGHGGVDLETEEFVFEWTMKPRKGVGISASAITNPYIRLGGTLADPKISVNAIDSIATTGAAVATAGLSLLGRGIWNRVTAGKKVCRQAIAKIQQDDAR